MKRVVWSIVLALVILATLGVGVATTVSAAAAAPGAVYAMTNASNGNAVVIFSRSLNGMLSMVGSVSTQGMGSGSALDPLVSQGSLMLTPDGNWLLAVNAGSNDITLFQVTAIGLSFVSRVSSGGVMPVSLTISGNEVFVLNSGTPNITAFNLSGNTLIPVAGSTRLLTGATPAFTQVGFNQLGNWLVVTDKGDNAILVFSVLSGIPGASPAVSPSSGGGPFGFFFDVNDHLLVVEAGAGAVSSYAIMSNGLLTVISASVLNGQTAACWIAGNNVGNVFTANPGSMTISAYQDMVINGNVTLLNATEATTNRPLDECITSDGQFLYALDPASGGIDMFQINSNGHLTSLGTAPGGLAIYAQGIAVTTGLQQPVVPGMSFWGIVALVSLLGVAMVGLVRRRQLLSKAQ